MLLVRVSVLFLRTPQAFTEAYIILVSFIRYILFVVRDKLSRLIGPVSSREMKFVRVSFISIILVFGVEWKKKMQNIKIGRS